MKKNWLAASFARFLVVFLLFLCVFPGPLKAQRNYRKTPKKPVISINEDKRSWPGMAWLVGGVLSAGAVVVGIKNAKRTHVD